MTKFKDATHYKDAMYIGQLVQVCCERHAKTVPELAAVIGVGTTTLRDWINGKARAPYTAQFTLEALTQAKTIITV